MWFLASADYSGGEGQKSRATFAETALIEVWR